MNVKHPDNTKKKRNALPKHLAKKKTPKERRLTKKYPQRKFAVINRHCVLPQAVVKMNVKHALSGKKDSRYRLYLVRKQRAVLFLQRHGKGMKHTSQREENPYREEAKEDQ